MNFKSPLNKSRVLLIAGAVNILLMVLILLTAAHVNINIKSDTASISALAATFFDISLACLFKTINHFSVLFVIINTLISTGLVLIAVVINRSHNQVPVVRKLNFFTENR